jgi:hypothetical protein
MSSSVISRSHFGWSLILFHQGLVTWELDCPSGRHFIFLLSFYAQLLWNQDIDIDIDNILLNFGGIPNQTNIQEPLQPFRSYFPVRYYYLNN